MPCLSLEVAYLPDFSPSLGLGFRYGGAVVALHGGSVVIVVVVLLLVHGMASNSSCGNFVLLLLNSGCVNEFSVRVVGFGLGVLSWLSMFCVLLLFVVRFLFFSLSLLLSLFSLLCLFFGGCFVFWVTIGTKTFTRTHLIIWEFSSPKRFMKHFLTHRFTRPIFWGTIWGLLNDIGCSSPLSLPCKQSMQACWDIG